MTYLAGQRVELVHTRDPHTLLRPGDQGTVTRHDTIGDVVHIRWDSGSSLAMCLDAGDRIRSLRDGEVTIVGEGQLAWPSIERHTDRYGAVVLAIDDESPIGECGYVTLDDSIHGQHGILTAEVLAVRRSPHIGDLARGLSPRTPHVGDRIDLGTGTVFVVTNNFGAEAVGVVPDDDREHDWLDPHALFRVHHQIVRLTFTRC